MIPAEDPAMVSLFKGRLTDDPTLDSAAKLMSRKMSILKNPKTSQGFKKQAIKQIDPDIELYIKKLRQLPASLSVNADPTKLAKSLKDEEGDLVTPVQQKLLKRILSQVTPKKEPVTPRRAPKREPVTPAPTPPIKIPKKQPENVPWSELPFAEEGPETDLEGAVKKTLRKMKKNTAIPQTVKTNQRVDKLGSVRKKEKKIQEFHLGFYR